ncbi:MAG: LacI family DNA-binding transcriptional regulator [Anaerolineae bacterium]
MVVTLKDIADRAGVSTTTVSRILNGREGGIPIREETRQKVLAIANELGYKPNMMARALRGSRSSLIGVIAQNISSLFHSQILRGLNDTAIKRSYRVFLGNVQRQIDIAINYGSMFEQSHADGILIIGQLEGSRETLDILTQQHRFVVGVSDRVTSHGFPGVYADSVVGTHLALDHLWNLGHRRIICVTDNRIKDGDLRAEVYEHYMRQKGLEPHIRVFTTPRALQASYETGLSILSRYDELNRPTAIFAATDAIAIGLLQAAFQMGINVPRQISIVGFDDIDFAAFTIPPLTTIRQSGFEMGQIAANLLIDMIEHDQNSANVKDIVMTPTLVVRQSTAPPTQD